MSYKCEDPNCHTCTAEKERAERANQWKAIKTNCAGCSTELSGETDSLYVTCKKCYSTAKTNLMQAREELNHKLSLVEKLNEKIERLKRSEEIMQKDIQRSQEVYLEEGKKFVAARKEVLHLRELYRIFSEMVTHLRSNCKLCKEGVCSTMADYDALAKSEELTWTCEVCAKETDKRTTMLKSYKDVALTLDHMVSCKECSGRCRDGMVGLSNARMLIGDTLTSLDVKLALVKANDPFRVIGALEAGTAVFFSGSEYVVAKIDRKVLTMGNLKVMGSGKNPAEAMADVQKRKVAVHATSPSM